MRSNQRSEATARDYLEKQAEFVASVRRAMISSRNKNAYKRAPAKRRPALLTTVACYIGTFAVAACIGAMLAF